MNHLSPWVLTRILAVTLAMSVLTGCNTTVYEQAPPPPPPPPEVQYVPAPPPEEAPPPEPVYTPAPAPVVVIEIRTESDFYEPLGHYGRWVDVDGYGRCWTPAGVEREWRPYTHGRWCRTDAGWYWESDESWGWATCHYGRWFLDPNLGWVWVPNTQWAPAWVAWRDGGGYTGWAPLPPRARFRPDGALERPDDDVDPNSFVFVEQRRMLEPQRPQTVIVNNITVVQQTINVTKVVVVNKTVINEGPSPEAVARATGHAVNVEQVHTLRAQHEAPAIARDHLSTTTFQPRPLPVATQNRPVSRGNEDHNPQPNVPVQPQPQHAIVPENPSQPPAEVRPYVPPNQPKPVVAQPVPRPPDQTRYEQNPHPNLPKPPEQYGQGLNKPANQLPPPPDRGRVEAGHPVPEANQPEHRPEGNPPQVHPLPNQPRPEANPALREQPVPHGNEVEPRPGNRPGQPVPPQHQPPPHEQEKPKQAGEKPHPEEPKNRHSTTNAPPARP